jgi:hypothetical protein
MDKQNNPQNPTPTPTPPIPQENTPSPKTSNIFMYIVVIIIIIAVSVSSAVLYMKSQLKTYDVVTNTSIPSFAPSIPPTTPIQNTVTPQAPQITVAPDDKDTWKTFTNTDYGFSFKYPPNFTVSEKKQSVDSTDFDNNKVTVLVFEYSFTTNTLVNGTPDWSGFSIDVEPTHGKTIAQYYQGRQGVGGTIQITPVMQKNGADEAAYLTNIENGDRVYRVGNQFFSLGTFQNALLLPDGTDDVLKYKDKIYNTLTFSPKGITK